MIDHTQLEALPNDEKLRIVTTLWDQISRSNQPISIPEAVFDDAARRIEEMTHDSANCITEDEMWRRADELR